jgi:hypothetical protein
VLLGLDCLGMQYHIWGPGRPDAAFLCEGRGHAGLFREFHARRSLQRVPNCGPASQLGRRLPLKSNWPQRDPEVT